MDACLPRASYTCARLGGGGVGHECFEAPSAHVERLVSKETSEEGEGPWEDHLAEPVDAFGERWEQSNENEADVVVIELLTRAGPSRS